MGLRELILFPDLGIWLFAYSHWQGSVSSRILAIPASLITSKPNCPVHVEIPHSSGLCRENHEPYPDNVSRQSDSFFPRCNFFIEEIYPPSSLSIQGMFTPAE